MATTYGANRANSEAASPKGIDLPRCPCGNLAVGKVGKGRHARPYCREHLPADVRRFQQAALAVMLRGHAKYRASLRGKA